MKLLLSTLTFSTLLLGVAAAQPQPANRPHISPPGELKTKIDPGKISVAQKMEPTGERYSLHMSFAPRGSDTDDPRASDLSYECYGTLKINGEAWWEMPRKTSDRGIQQIPNYFIANNVPANPDVDGYSFTKSSAFNRGREFVFDVYKDQPQTGKLNISIRLWDADTAPQSNDTSKDDLFGKYDETVDLLKNGAGSYRWFWVDGNKNGSDFYLLIKHEKSLYDKPGNSNPFPGSKPVIDKPLIPGKLPGPGPVIKGGPSMRVIH